MKPESANSSYDDMLAQARAYSTDALPRAWGGAAGNGKLKSRAEDFRVEEILGFEPDGSGEHLLVEIEKRDRNTAEVAQVLAKTCGVRPMDVSYAGSKDRQAVARQWFSIGLPGKPDPDLEAIQNGKIRVLQSTRHSRKLRRGALKGNRFSLVVRDFTGDRDQAIDILTRIREQGFPNYFGAQRFGRDQNNLIRAAELFSSRRRMRRDQKGFALSAARSLLFNKVLAARVSNGSWDTPVDGDVFQLDGTKGLFTDSIIDEELRRRCGQGEIHPTGPLWGRDSRVAPTDTAKLDEEKILSPFEAWRLGLEAQGVAADRRALRAPAAGLQWEFAGQVVELEFRLQRGCFATMLVREWLDEKQASTTAQSAN